LLESTLSRACLACLIAAVAVPISSAEDRVDFNRDVRPILSETCFQCHGPDEGQRQADLRLDTEEGMFAESDDRTIVRSNDPSNSELIRRITSDDEDERMPPADALHQLSDDEIHTIRKWVEQGADWQGHWAWILPQRTVPTGGSSVIDEFIDAGMMQHGLQVVPQAGKVQLIRRLSFDLTGLPPKPQDVEAFLADASPDAWNRLVDRMLASPHYGERMAIYWLDLVRYADTTGIHGDNHREVSLFRDYVIRAFNANKPFDEFTREQLAGDLLPEPSHEQLVASGYNRMLMTTQEGGAQPKEYLAKYSADRVRNASTVWMGATLACAECHDHKFDPFTTRDFYQFAAFFADIDEVAVGAQPATTIRTPKQDAQRQALMELISTLEAAVRTPTDTTQEELRQWEEKHRVTLREQGDVASLHVVRPDTVESTAGQTLTVLDDDSVLASGRLAATDTYSAGLTTDLQNITGIQLEALTHPDLANGSLSRGNGNFILSRFDVSHLQDATASAVKIASALADYSQKDWPIEHTLDGKGDTGWAVDGHSRRENRRAVLTFENPLPGGPGTSLLVELHHLTLFESHNTGRFRLSLTTAETPSLNEPATGLPLSIAAVILKPSEQREEADRRLLDEYFLPICETLKPSREQLKQTRDELDQFDKSLPTTLVTKAVEPRMIRVLPRGNWMDESGDAVPPAVPGFLPPIAAQDRATRLDLAHWLTSEQNPLTARVFVNRLWSLMFGQGLVATPDDFGAQGTWPSHPELLDWLALEFIDSDWDVKHMIRLIASSAAYQRSSTASDEQRSADPYNRWLARQARFRLPAEMIRDNALAVSGLLVDTVGGPSAKPYQPAGYWAHLNFPVRKYEHDKGPQQYRRGLYTYWCRTFLHPSMVAFDAPTREEACVQRPRSNNALQALVLLNDPTYVEAARCLAEKALAADVSPDDERITLLFRTVLSRDPGDQERIIVTKLLKQQRSDFNQRSEAAGAILTTGQATIKEGTVEKVELAAWTGVCRAVLNLHETITRY